MPTATACQDCLRHCGTQAVATRYGKRGYVVLGTATAAGPSARSLSNWAPPAGAVSPVAGDAVTASRSGQGP
ncbi:hypothetical protein ACH4FX_35060 [Streptomyces sp. NPDC018019]|uniref:hypothetical protein n=1 Tax=Streptomyces sp. NPDC018019 TaxID=3365030 RepID=UPI00378B0731